MWFDETLVESIVQGMPLWLAFVMLFVSYLGSIYLIGPATVLVYLRGDSWRTATWPGIILGAYALFVFAKPLTNIPRPAVDSPLAHESLPIVLTQLHYLAVEFDTSSFPSGHAIAATVFYGLVAVDLQVSTRRKRMLGAALALALVGFSRVALGVHYVEDVIGGVILGLVFLGFVLFVRERVSNPLEMMLGLAALLAAAGVVVGHPIEGVALLAASTVALFAHRRLNLRDNQTAPRRTMINRSE